MTGSQAGKRMGWRGEEETVSAGHGHRKKYEHPHASHLPSTQSTRGGGADRITRDKEETRGLAATSDLRAWEGGARLVVLTPPLPTGCLESLEGTCAPMTGTGTVGVQTESAEGPRERRWP